MPYISLKAVRRAEQAVRQNYPELTGDEFDSEVENLLIQWSAQAAEDAEFYGEPDELESVANCDDWGTGEGAYHGRM